MDNINNDKTYGYIYKTTIHNPDSRLNGKYYIGQHKCKIPGKQDPKYFGSGKFIKRYIRKYGTDTLTCVVIEWASNSDELNQLEAQYVTVDTIKDENCLNAVNGGICGNMWECLSEEQLKLRDEKAGKSIKKKHQDPKFHQRWLEKNNEENRRIQTGRKIAKKWETDPNYREAVSKGIKEKWNNPEYRDKTTKKLKEAHMSTAFKEKQSQTMKKYYNDHPQGEWYTNGIENKRCFEAPDETWHKGKTNKIKIKKYWFNNGEKNIMAEIAPGPEWKRGQCGINKDNLSGKKIYNNGIVNRYFKDPPGDEWVPGKIKRSC